ncbi:MAG TPA: ribosomal protein S18-alanine N-acetyltransferase [Burkholderiales bacterium]|nr:ribosomal protein S18-alanine N-acetyltransferase [Burkholderiales bacterium]
MIKKNALKFRLAEFEELELIAEMDSKVNLTSWNQIQYLSCFNDESQYLYVLEIKDIGIIGAIAFSIVMMEADILQIWVKRDYQNQGYGKIILKHILNLLEKRLIKSVFLEVRENNKSAIIFYTKFGFQLIGTRKNYYKVGNDYFDALLMRLELNNEK